MVNAAAAGSFVLTRISRFCWWWNCSARYGLIDPDGVFPRPKQSWHLSPSYSMLGTSRRRIGGAILDSGTLRSLEEDHHPCSLFVPLILLLRNTRPVGHQASQFPAQKILPFWLPVRINQRIFETKLFWRMNLLQCQWQHTRTYSSCCKPNAFWFLCAIVCVCVCVCVCVLCACFFAGVCRACDFIIAIGGFEFNSIDTAAILLNVSWGNSDRGSSAAIGILTTQHCRPQCSLQPWSPSRCQPCSCIRPLEYYCDCKYGTQLKLSKQTDGQMWYPIETP